MRNKLPDKLTIKRKLRGDYTISVAGKQAEGSISFHVLRNEE